MTAVWWVPARIGLLGVRGVLAVNSCPAALEADGLRHGDSLPLTVRDDGVIEIRSAASAEAALTEAFEWSLGRYGETYQALAK
jgi:hypothetical protein